MWRSYDYDKDKQDWLTKFLVGFICLAPIACILGFHAWIILGVQFLWISVMLGLFACIFPFIDLWKEDKIRFTDCVKLFLQLSALVLTVLVFVSCIFGYHYLMIKDSSTSVRGIGVEDLAEAYRRNPNAYDVVMTDGFVQTVWAGYFTISTKDSTSHFSAAPIYKDVASASGVPLAWAIGDDDGYWEKMEGTYCAGAGVCGFKGPTIGESSVASMFDDGFVKAAKNAASEGSFEFVNGLPSVKMGNPYESLRESGKWYGQLYNFLFAFLFCFIVGNIDELTMAIKKIFLSKEEDDGESRPLQARQQ